MNMFTCKNTYLSPPNQDFSRHSRMNPSKSCLLCEAQFKKMYLFMPYNVTNLNLLTETTWTYKRFLTLIRCIHSKGLPVGKNLVNRADDVSDLDELNNNLQKGCQETQEKNFWGAISLILGTAVGPGMLGLPALTIRSGPIPSTLSIVLVWFYVISSIILVAELSFAVMEEDGVAEVSFTGLARKTLGDRFGSFVSLVYASLSFSLLVACVSGIGAIVSQLFPWLNSIVANAVFPSIVGSVMCLFPFKAIDAFNRCLCVMMLLSITSLVAIGLLVGRTGIFESFGYASWKISSVLPAIPVTVLTLGFHVITPFVCKIAGNTIHEARKAILIGGFIPLTMVLTWNLIILGLAGRTSGLSVKDPISLLLSVSSSSALLAVQGFAFTALATSLIGYAVSFPKQVIDSIELICNNTNLRGEMLDSQHLQPSVFPNGKGKVGFITFTYAYDHGRTGKFSCNSLGYSFRYQIASMPLMNLLERSVVPIVLALAVAVASLFSSSFSRALDFAGIYANCFLFGILPPLMVHIYLRSKRKRFTTLPGGDVALLLLFSISVVLAIWH